MKSVFDHLPKPAVIAHRGSSAHAPENTLTAFELAITHQADAIEMDARLTADGYVVLFHDRTLQNLTDGSGKIEDHTLQEIQDLRIITSRHNSQPDHVIPTLDETLAAFGQKILINVELKHFGIHPSRLPQKIINLVNKYDLEDRVLLSSFHPLALLSPQKRKPPLATGLLIKYPYHRSVIGKLFSALMTYDSLHLPAEHTSAEVVRDLQQTGKKVFAYTVNDPDHIRQLARLGIDGFFTDDPLAARNALDPEN